MSEEWGPWIEHDQQGDKPYGKGVYAQGEYGHPDGRVVGRIEGMSRHPAGRLRGWHKDDYPDYWVVIRYRIRKPRALIELLDMIANLPAPTQRVDA